MDGLKYDVLALAKTMSDMQRQLGALMGVVTSLIAGTEDVQHGAEGQPDVEEEQGRDLKRATHNVTWQ